MMTYLIYGDNIYYLDGNNSIFSIEGFHGIVREGFKKSNFLKPILEENNSFLLKQQLPKKLRRQTSQKFQK